MPRPHQLVPDDPLGLFTNDPPLWTVSQGKPYEAPCQTIEQANSQRKAAARKLRWHGNHADDGVALALEATLRSCKPARPCLSGACPICQRAQQRLFVMECISVVERPHPVFGGKVNAISIIPDFGRVQQGELANFDVVEFERKTREALKAAGITRSILGLDVSLNHEDGKSEEAYWAFQWWGFFGAIADPWRETLKAQVNASKLVSWPVMTLPVDSIEAAAAYAVKSEFKRRVSLMRANLDRDDRGPCRNTNDRLLRGDAWVELMLFLDHIGLERRLIWRGYNVPYEPLRSRAKRSLEAV
jgi:hypothetical protein